MIDAYSERSGRPLEVSQIGSLGDLKQNDHISNVDGIITISNFGSHSLGTNTFSGKDIDNILENEAHFGTGPLQDGIGDCYKENQEHGEENFQIMKKTGESYKTCELSSVKEISLKYSNCNVDVRLGQIQSHGSSESREKCKTLPRKVAPTDKLWDGRLQLNSSITVSAVAFFKSGEKMPGVKWSESIEVKGKVKLEAFEKYIQDLPRSRNRGLMVVSLRWKEGSSKTGLAGMKKVAKGYKEGDRVGFAQLSPGIDLYVCPRSEAIITILAKHGFFKGKTAIEENKDSLIGCVVWRRNQINLKSVEQKSERCTHQVAGSNVSPLLLAPESMVDPSRRNCRVLDSTAKDKTERDNNLIKSPLESNKFPRSFNLLASKSTPSNSPSIPAGSKTCDSDSTYPQVPVGHSLILESTLMDKLREGKQDLSLELLEPVLVVPPDRKQPSPILDSEDLPEFDFGISCGIISESVANKALDSVTVEKSSEKESRNLVGSTTLKSWPTSHQGTLANIGRHGLASDYTQKMPPQKKVRRHDTISTPPFVVDRQNRDRRMPCSTPVVPPMKNLFDNDDDMPEWYPPDVKLEKQSVLATNQSPNILIHSEVPKSIRPVIYAQNPIPSAFVAAGPPPLSTQASHVPFRSPVFTAKQAQPRPSNMYMAKGPSSSMETTCNPPFRPDSYIVNGKLPNIHGVWKGWMP